MLARLPKCSADGKTIYFEIFTLYQIIEFYIFTPNVCLKYYLNTVNNSKLFGKILDFVFHSVIYRRFMSCSTIVVNLSEKHT